MMEFIDELLEETIFDYEKDLNQEDVDEIIANLKNSISDYLYIIPDEDIPENPEREFDFAFENNDEMPIELIEKLEPKDYLVEK